MKKNYKKDKRIMQNYNEVKKILLARDGDKCSICRKKLTPENICVDHVFPHVLGGNDDIKNLRLVCMSCNSRYAKRVISGYEFEQYIFCLIQKNEKFRNTKLGDTLEESRSYGVDIITEKKKEKNWERVAIEIKYTTSMTIDRIKHVIDRFKIVQEANKNIKCVLLFPGKLAEKSNLLFAQNNIEVWDIDYLVSNFKNEIEQTDHSIFKSLFMNSINGGNKSEENTLIQKLKACEPGKENWSRYQKLIGEILSFLFSPPLSQPLSENSDASKVNRRDFVFPNYCDTGFWAYMRSRYHADYIVVDAKNYNKKISKKEILQMANYLKEYGAGLFGIIIARKGISESAVYTLRERWTMENKLIIILQDNDIEQMLLEKTVKGKPENIIRQIIEDFRLSL